LADDNLFITIARILAVFNITKAVDEHGNPIEPRVGYTPGVVSHLTQFPSTVITARSKRHEELVRSIEVDHPWEKSDVDSLNFDAELMTST
jgi:hypothetical protein